MTPLDFHQTMMVLSSRFAFRETSGYRDVLSNAQVGGHPQSRHMLWLARDVVLSHSHDIPHFVQEAKRQGLTVIDEGDHLHVQAP